MKFKNNLQETAQWASPYDENKMQKQITRKNSLSVYENEYSKQVFLTKRKKKDIMTKNTTSSTFPSTFPEFYHAYLIFSMLFVYYDFHMYSDVCCGSYEAKV